MDLEGFRFAITEADGETAVPHAKISPHSRIFYNPTKSQPPHQDTTPIHCLPVEVLREIFIYVPMSDYQSSFVHDAMSLWTSASQVCSLWRSITLTTPEFWTFLPLQTRHTHWADLSLECSSPLPISLNINANLCELEWYRRALLRAAPAVSRAREIQWGTVGVFDDEQEDFLDELTEAIGKHPAPFLESFDGQWYFGNSLKFGGVVPSRLRHVNLLFNYPANHMSLLVHAPLTHLRLVECPQFGILEALRGLSSLESLALVDSCDIRPSTHPVGTPQVPLPHLRKLELHDGQYEAFVGFMQYVNIPSDTVVDFRSYQDVREEKLALMIPSLTESFSNHFHESLQMGHFFQDLSINRKRGPQLSQMGSDCTFLLSSPTTPGPDEGGRQLLPELVLCDITGTLSFPYQPRLIPLLLPVLGPAIHAVQTLDVHGSRMRHLQEWMGISRFLSQVFRISVHGRAADGLVMALAAPAASEPPVPTFPRLQTLLLEGVVFQGMADERPAPLEDDSGSIFPEFQPIPEDSLPFIDGLLQALAHRAAAGHRIQRLVIAKCAVTADMVRSLRNSPAVEEVDWDDCETGAELPVHIDLSDLDLNFDDD